MKQHLTMLQYTSIVNLSGLVFKWKTVNLLGFRLNFYVCVLKHNITQKTIHCI